MKTLTPALACFALAILLLCSCGQKPQPIAAQPTAAASPAATITPLPLPARPTAPATASPRPTLRPTETRPPTHTPTQTPTFTPPPLASSTPPPPVDFKYQGLSGKARASLAPSCEAAGARFGLKVEDNPAFSNSSCVVLLVFVQDLSDAKQYRSVFADLYASTLVDQSGALSRRQAGHLVPDPNGNTLILWLSFYVAPEGQSFTWKLPDYKEVAIIPAQ